VEIAFGIDDAVGRLAIDPFLARGILDRRRVLDNGGRDDLVVTHLVFRTRRCRRNPYHPITEEVPKRRNEMFRDLETRTAVLLYKRFSISPEEKHMEAISMDLSVHEQPKGRQYRLDLK
jgi:hypothetical protein